MKTNPLRLPFYIYIYLYMYTQTSADINRMLKPQKMLKNLLPYYQKQEFLKKYKVVSNFQITEVFAGLLQNSYSWRAEKEFLMPLPRSFLLE